MSVGDTVEITYAEAIALKVEAAPKTVVAIITTTNDQASSGRVLIQGEQIWKT